MSVVTATQANEIGKLLESKGSRPAWVTQEKKKKRKENPTKSQFIMLIYPPNARAKFI
jgi:hypothetical protein